VEQGSESVAGEPRGRAAIYSVELEVFEGPLDLLLHLVRRHELDILDIPISFVAEKYLEYLGMMRALDLEIAGDYLVMAATLAWLKSRELLPAQPKAGEEAGADEEEGEDPREALIRRLVEYERFKNAAAELDALPMSGRDVFARGADIEMPAMDPGLAPVTLFRLAEAYYRVLTRAKINKSHEVQIEAVTVAQRMQQLTLMLDERQEFEFEGLFLGRNWSSELELRTMLVVTLMSILELVKLGVARVQQVPDTESIRIYRLSITEEARQQIEAYDEDQSFGAPVDLGPPQPSEAELDAAEELTLLAEALAGVHGADADAELGAEVDAVAANTATPVLTDMSEEAGLEGQVAAHVRADRSEEADPERPAADAAEQPDEELRLLAAELAALDDAGAERAYTVEDEPVAAATEPERDDPVAATEPAVAEPEPAESALDAELRLLAAELAALDAAEAVAEAVTFARGQVQLVHVDETDAANDPQEPDADDEDEA
jgi:segregation and condensation protein A